jgi:hypothetical protein
MRRDVDLRGPHSVSLICSGWEGVVHDALPHVCIPVLSYDEAGALAHFGKKVCCVFIETSSRLESDASHRS